MAAQVGGGCNSALKWSNQPGACKWSAPRGAKWIPRCCKESIMNSLDAYRKSGKLAPLASPSRSWTTFFSHHSTPLVPPNSRPRSGTLTREYLRVLTSERAGPGPFELAAARPAGWLPRIRHVEHERRPTIWWIGVYRNEVELRIATCVKCRLQRLFAASRRPGEVRQLVAAPTHRRPNGHHVAAPADTGNQLRPCS